MFNHKGTFPEKVRLFRILKSNLVREVEDPGRHDEKIGSILPNIFAIFSIAHGLVHAGLATAPIPNYHHPKPGDFFTMVVRSWLLPKLRLRDVAIRWAGIGLVVLATITFIVTGLGIFGVQGLNSIRRTAAVTGAGGSLPLLLVF